MPSKNVITSSIKESFLDISNNKKRFVLIFILQLLFVSSIIAISAYYMSGIIDSTRDILEYMQTVNLDTESARFDIMQQKSPLGEDPLLISTNYNEILKNLTFLLFFIFILFVIINGLIWYFASNLAKKKLFSLKNILPYLSRFLILSLVLAIFMYSLAYSLSKIVFSSFLQTKPVNFVPLLIITIIAIYFIYIAIPILNKAKFKEIINKTFRIGIKNFIPIFISYLIILILISASLLLIFYLIEQNLILLVLSLILLLEVFSWTKIYFSIIVKKLSGF